MPYRGQRMLTLAAAAALAGSPLLAGTAASAEPAGTVTFSGGCGLLGSGLGGDSNPDAAQVSVPSGTGMRFANQLGQAATLRLDGEAAAKVPAGGAAEVLFHNGPVEATMQISCLLGEPAGAVTIEVVQLDQPQPAQPPAPSGGGSSGGDPDQRPGGDTNPGTTGPGAGSASSPGSAGQPAGEWWSGDSAPPAESPAQSPAGTRPEPDAPAEHRPSDELSARWGLIETDPPDSGGSSTDPATVDQQAGDDELAAEQVSRTAESAPESGPVGPLALVATVCVVGVAAGAIRTMIVQRANRPELV